MRRWANLWVTWVWMGIIGAAGATSWRALTVEELSRQADLVVHGEVQELEVHRDAGQRIVTRVQLRPREVWKGRLYSAPWILTVGGGILGQQEETALGRPEFRVGDEVVVYAVRNPAGEWVTVGLQQGRFLVERPPGGGTPTATNRPQDPRAPSAAGSVRFPGARPLALTELRQRTLAEAAP